MEKIILNDEKAIGTLWFIPDEKFEEGKPCTGIIKERYQEGSVYEGQGEYDGKNFYRQGHGVQEFSNSVLSGEDFGGPMNSKLYKFVGNYNRHLSGWMYGNGIFYLVDQDDKPMMFVKGFYNATVKLSDWRGNFDKDILMNGFTPEMEGEFVPFRAKYEKWTLRTKDVTSCDYLFMGDSWVENWTNEERIQGTPAFYEETKALNMDVVNVGIGGSKYSDWEDWVDELVIKNNPKKIFINLGFNDIHHGQTVDEVYGHFKNIVETLKKNLPSTHIFIASTCQCPAFPHFEKEELAINKLMQDYCDGDKMMTYLPVNELFKVDGKMMPDMAKYCVEDMLHLNRKGYDLWAKTILDAMRK